MPALEVNLKKSRLVCICTVLRKEFMMNMSAESEFI